MTSRKSGAIANVVRKLPAVAALQELWQPRTADGETEEEYWAWLEWLDRGATRGAPDPTWKVAASRWDWAGRALAYERAEALERGASGPTAQGPAAEIADNLTQMLRIETKKLLKRSATEVGESITLKDAMATLNAITEIAKESTRAQQSAVDYSKLSTEELRTFLALQRKLQGK